MAPSVRERRRSRVTAPWPSLFRSLRSREQRFFALDENGDVLRGEMERGRDGYDYIEWNRIASELRVTMPRLVGSRPPPFRRTLSIVA